MNPKNFLYVDYDSHESFNFPNFKAVPIDLIEQEVIRFNNLYRFAEKLGVRQTLNARKKLTQELVSTLNLIFSKLASQSSEKEIEFYYNELGKNCKELLLTDLAHYFRDQPVYFKGEGSSLSAAELFSKNYFTASVAPEVVDKILAISNDEIEGFKKNVIIGKVSREDLSLNNGEVVRKIVKILNQEFSKMGILNAVSVYLGKHTHVTGCALEMSTENSNWWKNTYEEYSTDPKSAYFHFDEAIDVPKSILYLTDTGTENGPTGLIPNTLDQNQVSPLQFLIGRKISTIGAFPESLLYKYYMQKPNTDLGSILKRKHFMNMPPELRFNSHFGFDVIPNSEQERNLISAEVKLTGSAGACLIFDGSRLLHRGGLVQKGYRIALQIVFGKNESFFEKVKRKILKA